jgi:hypothetical protein
MPEMYSPAIPLLSSRAFEMLAQAGHKFTAAVFFSSLTDEYVRGRLVGLSQLVLPHMWLDLMKFQKGVVLTAITYTHVNDGQVTLDGEGDQRRLHGDYLVVGLPIKDANSASDAFKSISHFVGTCRLLFGLYVFREVHLRGVWSVEARELVQFSEPVLLDPQPPPELLDVAEVYPNDTPALNIVGRAAELIGTASQTADRALRFLILWTSIEVQIGNGKKRKDFCLGVLKSEAANNQLHRLQKLRSAFLKDGEAIEFTAFDEYCLISILRLASMAGESERISLCKLFERSVMDANNFPKYHSYRVQIRANSGD